MGRPPFEVVPAPGAIDGRLAWLDRVGEHLRMPDDRRDEVLEEIAAHLDDAIDALIEEGLTIDQAEREAMARLGSPEELGEDLRKAHQTTRRLFAAAGGGVWRGLEGLITGYLISFVWAIPVFWGGAAIGAALAALTGRDLAMSEDLMLGYVPLLACGALWLAARRATHAVARASWRREHTVRVPVAVLGLLVIGLLVLTIPADQTWVSLIATLAMPFAFAAGAISAGGRADGSPWAPLRWPSRLPSRRKVLWGLVIGCVVLPMVVSVVGYVGFTGGGSDGSEEPAATPLPVPPDDEVAAPPVVGWAASGYTVVAPAQVADQTRAVDADWTEQDGWTLVEFADDVVDWSTLPGIQVELWRASSAYRGDTATLVDPERGPYRVVPVADPWATPRVAVQAGTPGGVGYLLFVVSLDPVTGARTVVGEPSSGRATFHGTPLEWFAAL